MSTTAKVGLGVVGGIAAGVLAVKAEEKVHEWGHEEKQKLEHELQGLGPHGSISFGNGSYSSGSYVSTVPMVAGGAVMTATAGPIVEVYQPVVVEQPIIVGGGGRVVEYVETGPTYVAGGSRYVGDEVIVQDNTIVENTTMVENTTIVENTNVIENKYASPFSPNLLIKLVQSG